MNKNIARAIALIVLLNTSACGFLIYPERKGQTSGKIDPTIVILDAAGLVFGLLPGVVAFAVDIATGTIYLSPGETSAIEKHSKDFSVIEGLNLRSIEQSETTIDNAKTANKLSFLIDQSINEDDIKYFKSENINPIMLSVISDHNINI